MCDCVGALNGADDTLGAGDVLKCVYRFVVGDGNVFRPAYLVKVSVLRTDTGVVKTCGDRVNRRDLTVFVLAEQGLHAVEDTERSGGDGSRSLAGVDAASSSR